MSLDDIRNERIRKYTTLVEKGINPYPATSGRTTSIQKLLEQFDTYQDDKTVVIAGRVMSIREHGGTLFADVYDGTGKIQGYLKIDTLGEEQFKLFEQVVDVGDFIDIEGVPTKTKRGEYSVLARSWKMLTKSLLPLPDKWYGFEDYEERFRKRYLDILFHPELRDMVEKKDRFWNAIRTFLKNKGFIEVETPTLELTTGGAEATPFQTHHNDFDLDMYLRICVGELWQKRLMAAGLPRTFEIGRVYRNEGSSPEHLQEFTNIEFYAAYMDYREGMKLTEEMFKKVIPKVFGTTKFSTRGFTFDLNDEWQELDYVSTVERMAGINVLTATEDEMKAKLEELHVEYAGENKERLTDTLWKYCRKQIAGPAWLINHPKLVSPLSKAHPDNPLLTERAQLLLAGAEVTNSFSELNDPIDQRERFELQQKLIESGDTEAMMPEWEFVEMLEHGMPPTFGFGAGDRLFAFLVDKPIRETQLFPLMKPKHEGGAKKSKETKIAVAVINKGAGMLPWQEMNTVAHLNAAFGARKGEELFSRNTITTKDDESINLNIQYAIMIKEAHPSDELYDLAREAKAQGLDVAEFTREMLETTNDNKVAENTRAKNINAVEYLGVLVFGEKSKVEARTDKYKLYS